MDAVPAPVATPAPVAAPAAPATLLGGTAPAAAPVATGATPQPGGWFKDDSGSFAENWHSKLPGELKDHASLKSIPSLELLAKNYVETKGMVGKRLQMPGEGATPEELGAWRKVTGAPEKPEGYLGDAKTIRPDTIPEGLWDPAGEKKFLAIAHKHSLPPAAVKDILAYYGESIATSLTGAKEQEGVILQAEGAKLRTAWGKDYDGNLALSERMALTVGLDPKTHPIFTNADVVQAFAKMGKLVSEDKLVTGGAPSIAATIASKASEITDPKSMSQIAREYRGEFGPERQAAAQAQLHNLYAAAEPKK